MIPRIQTSRFPSGARENVCSSSARSACGSGGGPACTRPPPVLSPCNMSVRPQALVGRSIRDGGLLKARHDAVAGRHRPAGNTF